MLFYVAELMSFVAGRVDQTVLAVVWAHVGLRAIHSAIQLSCNKVTHRMVAFALSNVVLAVFWMLLFV